MSDAVPGPKLVVSRPLALASEAPMTPEQRRRLREPMVAGGIVVLIFVVGFLVWAGLFSVAGGVPVPGQVVVENNRKTVEQLEAGTVREIRVQDGDHVTKGQILFVMDDTQARASVDVFSSQYDALVAQRARLEAELAGSTEIAFPPELLARRSNPQVANLIRGQETLFRASRGVYESQSGVLNQRVRQLESRAEGLKAQVDSVDQQTKLVQDELSGVQSLYDKGFAPKTRLLALQRSQAGLLGDRGARQSEIASVGQAVGEARIQMAQLREQRATQAADTLRQVQMQIAEVEPRLTAAQATLEHTIVRAPADGVVLGLTKFTEGGVVKPGEKLLDIVPQKAPLIVRVMIRPDHITEVKPGMEASVRLTAYHSRTIPSLKAKVLTVSADRITTEKGEGFFTADLVVDQAELKKLPQVKLSPGMPAQAIIVTGQHSILQYLIGPFTDTFRDALHES